MCTWNRPGNTLAEQSTGCRQHLSWSPHRSLGTSRLVMLLLQAMWHLLGLLWDEPYTGDLEMISEWIGHQSVGADVSTLGPLTSSSQLSDRTAGSNGHFCTGPANQIVFPIHLNCQCFYECQKGRKMICNSLHKITKSVYHTSRQQVNNFHSEYMALPTTHFTEHITCFLNFCVVCVWSDESWVHGCFYGL